MQLINAVTQFINMVMPLFLRFGAHRFSPHAQTLTEPTSNVRKIDMSENGEFPVLRDYTHVYLYTNNGSNFLKKSNFTSRTGFGGASDITTDTEKTNRSFFDNYGCALCSLERCEKCP